MATDPDKDGEHFDIALVGGATEDGAGHKVLRLRPEGASLGEIRPLQEGHPIHGEVVQLKPRREAPAVCDVEVAVRAPAPPPSNPTEAPPPRHGPAQVSTPTYRANWERIFGGKKTNDGDVN
jgi:hypothetical protein